MSALISASDITQESRGLSCLGFFTTEQSSEKSNFLMQYKSVIKSESFLRTILSNVNVFIYLALVLFLHGSQIKTNCC